MRKKKALILGCGFDKPILNAEDSALEISRRGENKKLDKLFKKAKEGKGIVRIF